MTSERAGESVFNEDSLRADIVKTWGVHGAHVDVFDFMVKELSALRAVVKALDGQTSTERRKRSLPWMRHSPADEAYERAAGRPFDA